MSLDPRPAAGAETARVFIGTDPTQEIACRLLQFSMRRHASMEVEFDTMENLGLPFPTQAKNQPRTGFSFNRFAIPGLAGYHGRAMYCDADMLVFKDVRELWDLPFDGATVLHCPSTSDVKRRQFSVLVLDCDRLRWNAADIVNGLDEGRYSYEQLFWDFCIEPPGHIRAGLPMEWNSLDLHVPGKTALIHYTHMESQPWVYAKHEHGDVWVQALVDAIDAGAVRAADVDDAIGRGWIRPSLARQIRVRPSSWKTFTRLVAPLLDIGFTPHRELRRRQREARKREAAAA